MTVSTISWFHCTTESGGLYNGKSVKSVVLGSEPVLPVHIQRLGHLLDVVYLNSWH